MRWKIWLFKRREAYYRRNSETWHFCSICPGDLFERLLLLGIGKLSVGLISFAPRKKGLANPIYPHDLSTPHLEVTRQLGNLLLRSGLSTTSGCFCRWIQLKLLDFFKRFDGIFVAFLPAHALRPNSNRPFKQNINMKTNHLFAAVAGVSLLSFFYLLTQKTSTKPKSPTLLDSNRRSDSLKAHNLFKIGERAP